MRNLARYRKFIVALLAAAAVIGAELPPDAPGWLTGTFAVLGAFGVLAVRNARPVTREDLAREVDYHVRPERPKRGGYSSGSRRASDMPPPQTGIKPYRQPGPRQDDDDLAGPPRRHVRGDLPVRPDDDPGTIP
jgi:hypothetical protein